MPAIEQVIEGLKIFVKYDGVIAAAHDTIYVGPSRMRDEKISKKEDQDKLNELDWKFNDGLEAWYYFV